jgi:hypothetical protein
MVGYKALDMVESEDELANVGEEEENPSETDSVEGEKEVLTSSSSSQADSSAADSDSEDDAETHEDRWSLIGVDKDAAFKDDSLPLITDIVSAQAAVDKIATGTEPRDVQTPPSQLVTPPRQRASQLPPLHIQDPSQPSLGGTISLADDTLSSEAPSSSEIAATWSSPKTTASNYLSSPEYSSVTLRRGSPVTSPARNRSVRSDFISSLVDQQQQQEQQQQQQQQQQPDSSGNCPLKLEIPSSSPDIGLPPLPKSSPPKFTGIEK